MKKRMKTKLFFLISLFVFLNLFSFYYISAYDWNTYGYDGLSSNVVSPSANNYGRFDLGFLEQSMSHGNSYTGTVSSISFQPLIDIIGNIPYLFLVNGNYIQVYNGNLQLIGEQSCNGRILSQIGLSYFSMSSASDSVEISAVVEDNSSLLSFETYMFNTSTYGFTKTFEKNYTTSNSNLSIIGLKSGINNGFYFIQYKNKTSGLNYSDLNFVNYTDSSTISLPPLDVIFTENIVPFDLNADGVLEVFTYSPLRVMVFDSNGILKYDYNYSGTATQGILDAKLFKADSTNQYRVFILQVIKNGAFDRVQVYAQRLDRSTLWSNTDFLDIGSSSDKFYGKSARSSRFYSSNGYDYVYIAGVTASTNSRSHYYILDGNTGSLYYSYTFNNLGRTQTNGILTLADMNNNNFDDFIFSQGNVTSIFDPAIPVYLLPNRTAIASGSSCIPVQYSFDGFLDIVCTSTSNTTAFYSNLSNQNSYISSVSVDPSQIIATGQTLNILISATDPESDTIYYSRKCFEGDSYSSDSVTSTLTCIYNSSGIYNITVRVKDIFHSTYNYASFLETVTTSGSVCNNNGTCDSSIGETNSNCPFDCPSTVVSNTTSVVGGTTIPNDLVNVENTEQGLLPEIYYGTLGFMSYVLTPSIILIFIIFFVLIIFAIGKVIKNIAYKI